MLKNILDIIYIISQIAIPALLVYFTCRQTQINKKIEEINKRMQELEDYVAVSIIPITNVPGNNYELQIMNTGKINVYLRKFEKGKISVEFPEGKERLISVGGNPFYRIPISVQDLVIGQELEVKLYLIDEFGNKYLSLGGFIIDPQVKTVPVQIQDQQNIQHIQRIPTVISGVPVIIPGEARACTYKTIKYEWKI
jgi:hypothetical protein